MDRELVSQAKLLIEVLGGVDNGPEIVRFLQALVEAGAKITEMHVEIERLKDDRNRSGVKARAEFLPVIEKLKADKAALRDWLAEIFEVSNAICPVCRVQARGLGHDSDCTLAKMLEAK